MLTEVEFVIPQGADGSEVDYAQLSGRGIYRLVIPENFNGSALTVDEDWQKADGLPLRNASGPVSIAVTPGSVRQLTAADYPACRGVRLIADEAQDEEVTIVIVAADFVK